MIYIIYFDHLKNIDMKKVNYSKGKVNMKICIIIMCLFGLILNLSAKGGDKKRKDKAFLHIEANLEINQSKTVSDTKVELFCHSELIDSVIVGKSGSFEFDLKKDLYYTIKISKNGYIPKIIGIDTEAPADINEKKEFVFTTSLLSENEAFNLDRSVLEFPAALVMYYNKSSSFEFCLEYATVRKQMLVPNSEIKEK